MAWGLSVTSRVLRARGFVILWAALTGMPVVGVARSAPTDAPAFTLTPKALYAAASAPGTPDGANVSVLEFRERYVFEADGSNQYTQYFVYKILSAQGAQAWNTLGMGWSPWLQDKPSMKARVVLADGTTYTLDQATITDSPARVTDTSIYSDARMLRAPLPAIAPGAVVETEIVMRERLPFAGAGKVARSYFETSEPVHLKRLILEAPKSLSVRHRLDLLSGVTPVHTQDNNVNRWVFESGPTSGGVEITPGLPGDVYEYPMVTFSTGASWQELSQAYYKIVAERLAESNVNDLVARLTANRTSREAKVSAIIEYLNREVRYTGIEFDQASVFPASTAKTLSRKYGDCKDKSLLLVAMLRAAGIPAHLALLNVGERLDVPAELPGMGLFDHAIVYVPGEPALWIDATDDAARLGQLPDTDRGRLALIVDANTTALTRVDDARSIDNVVYEEREIRLKDYGPASVVEVSKPRGNYEADLRRVYASLNDQQARATLADYVKKEYFAKTLDKLNRSDPKDFSRAFQVTLESSQAERGQTTLTEAVAYIRVQGLFNSLPLDLQTRELADDENAQAARPTPKRSADYVLPRPFVSEWHYHIVPPPGFVADALPETVSLDVGPAKLTQNFAIDGDGSVRANFRFDTVKRRLTPAEYSALRNKVAALKKQEGIRIKFDLRAHRLFTQGQARESFAAYRQLIQQHPKDPIQYLRRADALLRAGMGEAARKDAAAAVKLAPASAFAQRTLAKVLQHDLIGRLREPGADFAGAAAAFRAAIALDPADKSLVADYAILLEYDSSGERYGPKADLKGAIAQYRKLTARQLNELGLAYNLPYVLLQAGDCEGALQAARAMDSPELELIVACEAQLRGAAPALEEARRRTQDEAKFKEVAAGAADLVLSLREYSKAADLYEASASGAEVARAMVKVSYTRQAKRYEELKYANSPEGVVQKLIATLVSDTLSVESMLPLVSRNARLDHEAMTPEDRERQAKMLQKTLRKLSRGGPSKQVMMDITLSAMQVRSTGDDAVGYRVVWRLAGADAAFFVVKENGEYKILDTAEDPVPLAREVLDRLERQDLTGASTLLGWARESRQSKGGDDPFSGDPLLRFWSAGQTEGDVRGIQLAAASILVKKARTARRGMEILESIKAQGAAGAEAESIEYALLTGYEQLKDRERALATAVALSERAAQSRRLFNSRLHQLRALKRFKEADELAEQRLKMLPDDVDALRALSENAASREDYAGAYEWGRQVNASRNALPSDLNYLAWLSLFFEREGGPDVESALRALDPKEMSGAVLHTLGCLYADVGKTREAREVLLQAMDVLDLAEPDSDYWYAFGRIAEQYGERDVALGNYSKVKPPKDATAEYISTYRLAQNRVKVLGGKAAPEK